MSNEPNPGGGDGGFIAIIALGATVFVGAVISAWDAGKEYGIRWERRRVRDKQKEENERCR